MKLYTLSRKKMLVIIYSHIYLIKLLLLLGK